MRGLSSVTAPVASRVSTIFASMRRLCMLMKKYQQSRWQLLVQGFNDKYAPTASGHPAAGQEQALVEV